MLLLERGIDSAKLQLGFRITVNWHVQRQLLTVNMSWLMTPYRDFKLHYLSNLETNKVCWKGWFLL